MSDLRRLAARDFRADHRFMESMIRSILCLVAIPDGNPVSTFAGIALEILLTLRNGGGRGRARYTLILGTKNWSSWSLRPYLAMRATGAAFDEIVIALRRPETQSEIRKHSRPGACRFSRSTKAAKPRPCSTAWRSARRWPSGIPKPGLWPDDGRARARARAYAAEMHSGFPPLRTVLSMEIARSLPTPALDADVKADIARILEAWERRADALRPAMAASCSGAFRSPTACMRRSSPRFRTYGIALPALCADYSERVFWRCRRCATGSPRRRPRSRAACRRSPSLV